MINSYWNQNSNKILSPLLGYPVFDKPTASEFISMLADYIQDHSPR